MRHRTLGLLTIAAVVGGGLWAVSGFSTGAEEKKPAADPALARARREVKMLDDLYKTAVIYINDVYVKDATSHAAGAAARDLFDVMRKKKWHDARLVDATGSPVNGENKPQDKFEKAAIEKLKAGDATYEEITEEDGQKYLRVATVVPVVNEKCLLCHPNFKVGDVLGGISYKLNLADYK